MSSCAGTGARPLTVWCMPWPHVLHDSVDVVSCASFPPHPSALLYCIRCGSVSTTILHAYCTAVLRQQPRQSRTVPPPALVCVCMLFCFLFFCPRCPVWRRWPRSHCSLRPGPTARSSLVSWPSRCHPYRTTALRDNRLVQPHGQQTVTWVHHLMLASSGASQRFPCKSPARSWDSCRVCDGDGGLDRRLSPSSCQTAAQPS